MTRTPLFRAGSHENFRVVVTGPVGVDKKPFLERLVEYAAGRGHSARLFNVGDMMYAEAPDVAPGRILDVSLGRLNTLRRSVFKEVLSQVHTHETVIVNTHAAFRWKHGLFPAFDHDQMLQLDADLYVTLIDNVDAVHERLDREHHIRHTLKDILVWREEEILATEVLANVIRGHGSFYILARGEEDLSMLALYRLIFHRHRKVYPSFPMTHIMSNPHLREEVNEFRRVMAEHFVAFDPADLEDSHLQKAASEAAAQGKETMTVNINGRDMTYRVADVVQVAKDIDAQIYARDFKLIEQSDMIVSLIPAFTDGRPCLSSGVERELQHAHECTKEVFVVWRSPSEPSPFVTETATKVFRSVAEAMEHFLKRGYIEDIQLPLTAQTKARA
ncbi:MAG: AAA family ATPase [Phycisphaerae bacterium]|nr:AAA family ATPase [Phycisphaerae bacterium]